MNIFQNNKLCWIWGVKCGVLTVAALAASVIIHADVLFAQESQAASKSATSTAAQSAVVDTSHDEVTKTYRGSEILKWEKRIVDEKDCYISPMLDVGAGCEANHHRIVVAYKGGGLVEVGLVHSKSPDLTAALSSRRFRTPLMPVKNRVIKKITSSERAERYSWVLVRSVGSIELLALGHSCWRGRGTLYGHVARTFEFAGAKLPYRIMLPRNYNPDKSYPLVVSVSGSGGVGTDNIRNMEKVVLARYLFTNYYNDEEMECISIVPQIPSESVIPAPYWPGGQLGGPERIYHPDWPAVNEQGWYVQATLALIQKLIDDKDINIDTDRVYYAGFSYGGKACWEFLKAGRGVFAAAVAGGGWPVGKVYTDPEGPLLTRLKLEVRRYKHIPTYVFVGEYDSMRPGSKAVHDEILAQGGKSTYVEFPATAHVPSAAKAWGNRNHVAWLFAQNRKNNPPPGADPFPGGAYPSTSSAVRP